MALRPGAVCWCTFWCIILTLIAPAWSFSVTAPFLGRGVVPPLSRHLPRCYTGGKGVGSDGTVRVSVRTGFVSGMCMSLAQEPEGQITTEKLYRELLASFKAREETWQKLLQKEEEASKKQEEANKALLKEKDEASKKQEEASKKQEEASKALLDALMRAKDMEIKTMEMEIKTANQDVLRASSLLTGRGVLERCLYLADREMSPRSKRFVASEACRRIGQRRETKPGRWEKVLLDSHARVQNDFPNSSVAKQKPAEAYEALYVQLSHDLHNYQWSGLKVRVLDAELGPENVGLITGLAEEVGLDIECVSKTENGGV